jgi:hypothetical protein
VWRVADVVCRPATGRTLRFATATDHAEPEEKLVETTEKVAAVRPG